MNLKSEILKEHSARQKSKIVSYIGCNPKRFKDLVILFMNEESRLSQRAAWPLSTCVEKYPSLVLPHLKDILLNLRKPLLHQAVKRNTVRLLQFIDIPVKLQGMAADTCLAMLADTREPIAVRCFSMTVLCNLAEKEPELKNEIIPLIEDQLPFGSPGFISRAKKSLKKLQHLS